MVSIAASRVSDKIAAVSRHVFAALTNEFEDQYFAFVKPLSSRGDEGRLSLSIHERIETGEMIIRASVLTSSGEMRGKMHLDPLTAMTSYGAQYMYDVTTNLVNEIGERIFKHEWRRISTPVAISEPSRREVPKVEETIYETVDIPMMDGTIRRETVRHTSDLHPTPHPKAPMPEEKIERNADFGTW